MADIVINPAIGKIDFFTTKGENVTNTLRLTGNTLLITGPLSASSISTGGGGSFVTSVQPTSNYLSKFTGNSTIANSLIYDNGTNIGIGTTSPAAKLDVQGTFNATGTATLAGVSITGTINSSATEAVRINNNNGYISFYNTAGSTRHGYLQGLASGAVVLAAEGSAILQFIVNGSERVRINTNGNVGIGTTSPSTKLHIYENANRVTYISQNDNHTARFEAYGTATAIDTTASNGIFFRINSGDIVKFAADGNVGIGTSTATAPLHIYRASNPWIRLNGGGSFGYIRLDDGTSNGYLFKNTSSDTSNGALAGALYTYTDSGKAFQHIHSGTPLFTILSGGNVGIGTTSPATLLHVDTAGADARIRVSAGTNTVQGGMIANTNGLVYAGSITNHGFSLRTNDTDRVRIQTDGNVGIGTTTPTQKLEVAGYVMAGESSYRTSIYGNAGGAWIAFGATNNTVSLGQVGAYNSLFNINSINGDTSFQYNYSEKMRITTAGNVGIGTTSPTTKLAISDGTTIAQVNPYSGVAYFGTVNNYPMALSVNSSEKVRIFSGGSVSFGTTADTLFSAGNIYLNGATGNAAGPAVAFGQSDSITGTIGHLARITGGGTSQDIFIQSQGASNSIGLNANPSGAAIYFQTQGAEKVRITAAGNVGIGTTSPSGKLHVLGASYTAASAANNNVRFEGGGGNGLGFGTIDGTSTYASWIQSGYVPNFATATYALLLNPLGGNVGIGTTSPNKKLQIIGSIGKGLNLYEVAIDNLVASATQAKRYEISRVFIDYNDWNSSGTIEIEVRESYYSDGRYKKYIVSYGYNSSNVGSLWLVEDTGRGANDFKAEIGAAVQVTGDIYYVPIYIDVDFYQYVDVLVRTNRTRTTNASSPSGGVIYINESPTGSNISSFSPDEVTYISLASNKTYLGYSGNVGIGTTSPSQKLHIVGTAYSDTDFRAPIFYDSNNTAYYLDPANSGTSLLVAGSIGAGLTTPLHKIQASGLISASDATYNNNATFIGAILNNDATNPGLDLRRWNGGAAGNNHGATYIATNIVGDTIFYNGLIAANTRATNEKMRIAVNGNVGIGITTPVYKTEIYSGVKTSTFTGLSISNFNNYDGTANSLVKSQLRFAILENPITTYDASQRTFAILESGNEANNSSSDGFFAISTRLAGAVAEKFRINSAGNVGIGTTSPGNNLVVYNGSGWAGTDLNGTSGGELKFLQSGTLKATIYASTSTGLVINGGNETIFQIGGSEKMRLTGGNLGIGTTSPASILHLNGTAPTILTLGSTSYPSTYLSTFGVDSGARAFLIFGNNGENQIRAGRTTTGGYLDFYTNNTVSQTTLASDGNFVMRLAANGNVGIGTTDFSYTINDNTRLVGSNTNNRLFVNGSIQLLGNNDAIVFGRGTSTFLTDEELGFGWGGGWYMTDATYLRVRNDKVLYSAGEIWGSIFKDSNDTTYLGDFASRRVTNINGFTARTKMTLGLTAKYQEDRADHTQDTSYWVGAMGWGTVDMNTLFDYGCGFIDTWGNPANQPSGTSHWTGIQSMHYTNGTTRYGWQMVGGPIQNLRFRNTWSTFSSWKTIPVLDVNDGNSGAMYAGVYYDASNTAYYLDPASTSVLNTLTLSGILTTVSSGTAINFSGQSDSIGYNATAGLGTYIKGTGTTYIYGGGVFFDGTAVRTLLHSNNYGGYSAFSGAVSSGGNITATGYIYTSTYLQTGGNLIYPSGYGATQRLEVGNSANNNWIDGLTIAPGGIVTAPNEMRSPIFYDSNDTSYYVDPNSASVLNGLRLVSSGNQVSGADFSLWIQGSNNDWGIGIDKSTADYGITYNLAASHTFGIQGRKNDNQYFRVGTDMLFHDTRVQAPIFYDSANTSYYVDPASTSVLYSIAAGAAGNSSANIPALKVTSAGTATTQAAIAIQQQTSEGDTIIFCDYDQYVEWNLVHENVANQLIVHGGSSTGNLGSNTFYSPNGTAKTGYIKHVFDQTDGNAYIGGSVGIGTNGPGQKLDVRGTIISNADVRAPLFYDSADTAYYLDLNGGGSLIRGRVNITGGHNNSSLRVFLAASENGIATGIVTLQQWCSEPGNTWEGAGFGYNVDNALNEAGNVPAYYFGRPNTNFGQAYMRMFSSGDWYFYNTQIGTNTRHTTMVLDKTGYVLASNSIRSPIFYDSDNTAYYLDPNSNTSLRTVGSWRSDSSAWDGEFSGKIQYHGNNWYFQAGNLWIFRNSGASDVVSISQGGLVTANSFTGAGTGLTGTAASLNIGGNAVTATSATTATTATTATSAGCVNSDTGNVGGNRLQYWQVSGNTTLNPDGEWYNAIRMGHGDPVAYYSNTLAVRMTGGNLGDIYTRTTTNGTAGTWNRFWHNNNDGAGSGLDADLLDGNQAAAFALVGGSNASGTWAINITGNAATATSATTATTATGLNSSNYISRVGSSGNYNTDFQNTPAGTVRHLGDDYQMTNNPGGGWWFVDNYRHYNASNYWGTQVAWGWEDQANKLATRNVQNGTFGSWVYYLNSVNYTDYTVTKTGTGASGTWAINISGNAATATTATNVTIANGSITLAKIENITAYTILGNSNASAAATPAALSVATVATMLSGQTMNINGSSTSCSGNATTATTATNATVNANNTSAAWYPVVWHSGNTLYSSAGVLIYAGGNYLQANYFNSSDDVSTGNISHIVAKFGDNYYRSATAAKVAAFITGQTMNINGSSTSCSGNATSATTAAALITVNNYQVATLGINTAPSNKLHINGDNTNPAIRVDNGAINTSVASNGRIFYGWLPISIAGTTRWIQLYT